jgi:hypothetical protein
MLRRNRLKTVLYGSMIAACAIALPLSGNAHTRLSTLLGSVVFVFYVFTWLDTGFYDTQSKSIYNAALVLTELKNGVGR